MLSHNKIINDDISEIISQDLPWETLRDKTVLVTGASGMIPSYVVYTLLGLNDSMQLNINVIALVRNKEKAERILAGILSREDIKLIAQDVSEPLQTNDPIDYIIHGGSAAKPSEHKVAPTATIKANLQGTFNLLDLAVEKNSKGFVLMSSSEVYGTVDSNKEKISEDDYGYIDILNPRSCYSEGKRAAETICSTYKAQYGIDCKTPRFAHIYGPGLSLNDGRVQADFASKIIHDKDIVMNSDGSAIRAYTYVSDAVSGLFYVLLKGEDMAYNIANSHSIITIRQLAEAFINARPEKNLKLQINIPENNSNVYNPAKYIALDDAKLKGLGWTSRIDVKTGIDRMLSYYENEK